MSERDYLVAKGMRLPSGERVRFRTIKRGQNVSTVVARKKGKQTGLLHVWPDGEIQNIAVPAEHRRQGLATGMYKHAQSRGLNPLHASLLSEEGAAWRKAVGGRDFR